MAKNLISGPILAGLAQIWASKNFLRDFTSTGCQNCRKHFSYAISGKIMIKTQENCKLAHFGPDLCPLGPNSGCHPPLKNLALSVIRYDQLSPCKIPAKTNKPIFTKFSDGRTERWTDRRTRVISQDAVRLTSSVQQDSLDLRFCKLQICPPCCKILKQRKRGDFEQ